MHRRAGATLCGIGRALRSHATTLFGAAPTCGSTLSAVIHVMPLALFGAEVTYIGALRADVCGELAPSAHETCHCPADRGAIEIERNAPGQSLRLRLLNTGESAMVAGSCAAVTCVDAGLHAFVGHDSYSGNSR
jgi:hypothetical protein